MLFYTSFCLTVLCCARAFRNNTKIKRFIFSSMGPRLSVPDRWHYAQGACRGYKGPFVLGRLRTRPALQFIPLLIQRVYSLQNVTMELPKPPDGKSKGFGVSYCDRYCNGGLKTTFACVYTQTQTGPYCECECDASESVI